MLDTKLVSLNMLNIFRNMSEEYIYNFAKFTAYVVKMSHKISLKLLKNIKIFDEDGIRTHACRAHWISSPTP